MALASCGNLPRLLGLARLHFSAYSAPAAPGQPAHPGALFRRIRAPLGRAVDAVHLRETASRQMEAAADRQRERDGGSGVVEGSQVREVGTP